MGAVGAMGEGTVSGRQASWSVSQTGREDSLWNRRAEINVALKGLSHDSFLELSSASEGYRRFGDIEEVSG